MANKAGIGKGKAPLGRFLLLMRHTSGHDWWAQATEIAKGLDNYIKEAGTCDELAIQTITCLHAPSRDAERTAWTLRNFGDLKWGLELKSDDLLDPRGKTGSAYRGRPQDQLDDNQKLLDKITDQIEAVAGKNALLVIGHSPQIDWLLHKLLKPSWYRRGLPWYQHAFARGELICVELVNKSLLQAISDRDWRSLVAGLPTGRAIWTLTSTDSDTEPLLREKIKGKMESAKLLGGIVGAGLGLALAGFHDLASGWSSNMDEWTGKYRCETAWVLTSETNAKSKIAPADEAIKLASELAVRERNRSCVPNLDTERVAVFGVSISLLALAAGLYCLAYLSYDRLLMPTRFWAAPEPIDMRWRGVVWRPPSSSLLVMHQNMQRVWFRAFIPATLFAGAALVALAYSATIQTIASTLGSDHWARGLFILLLLVLSGILFAWAKWARPVFGAQD